MFVIWDLLPELDRCVYHKMHRQCVLWLGDTTHRSTTFRFFTETNMSRTKSSVCLCKI